MLDIKDILEATEGRLIKGGPQVRFSSVSTDTRTIKQGALFIAIKGPNFDGYNFIEEAKARGAFGVIVNEGSNMPPHPFPLPVGERVGEGFVIIEVNDTIKALGDIARSHRRKFDIPVIAITGSNGKTTTKEMAAVILAKKYNVLKNEGTENNFIGVPLTLLRLDSTYEIAVLELGSNHSGEIARLSEIVQPSCGVIVNVGPSHLEFFNTVDNVREEKLSLLKRLGSDSVSVINGDDARLVKEAKAMCAETQTFGLGADCDFRATDVKEREAPPFPEKGRDEGGIDFILNGGRKFHLNLLGKHNIYNALAATVVGSLYGVSVEEAADILKDFRLPKLRMEFIEEGGIKFIFDCYNSNPSSMAGAIETIKEMNPSGRKIVVAGDMLELGKAGPDLHKKIGRLAAGAGVDILMGVGPLSGFILEGAQEEGIGGNTLLHFENSVAAAKALKDILKEGDLVLVKGSRGMKMEEIKRCFTTSCIR